VIRFLELSAANQKAGIWEFRILIESESPVIGAEIWGTVDPLWNACSDETFNIGGSE
jgi:hypothetical protein